MLKECGIIRKNKEHNSKILDLVRSSGADIGGFQYYLDRT